MGNTNSYITVLGMRVDMVQMPDVLDRMESWIRDSKKGNYIVVSNADSAVWGKKDVKFRNAINCSNLSIPDGMSLVMLGKFYGHNLKRRVYGPELMEQFCKLAAEKGYSNYFYGATGYTLEKLKQNLLLKYPKLNIAGAYSPPFRKLSDEEDNELIEMISKAKPDVLWVGLGCPKQEIWMYEHKDRLNIPVMVGIGAAFDFHARTKKQAPRWMREHGLEWFFRLITEPRRLWKRYIAGGMIFLYNVFPEILRYKKNSVYGLER